MSFLSRFQQQPLTPESARVKEMYLNYFVKKIQKKTSLREASFVVLDTETTGLNTLKDDILSIAGLLVRDFQIDVSNHLEIFLKRQSYLPDESVQIHGIMARHLADGVEERDALIQLVKYIKNHIIVGHHISFDIQMINKALQKHFGFKLKNNWIDTGKLAQRVKNPMLTGGHSPSLDSLCSEYQIPLGKRHTASGDTLITALLFLKLLGRLESKKVRTIGELL